jgi:hypothetical protein
MTLCLHSAPCCVNHSISATFHPFSDMTCCQSFHNLSQIHTVQLISLAFPLMGWNISAQTIFFLVILGVFTSAAEFYYLMVQGQ